MGADLRVMQQSGLLRSLRDRSSTMKKVASIILCGGEGTRLHPLTLSLCKPAIHFGGKYRLIDIPLSNSIYANCYKTYLITQFLSSSLHRHIFETYHFLGREQSGIEILTAEQKHSQAAWFKGTADAVRQNMDYLLSNPVDYFLILSGDQLYNIDFGEMLSFAQVTNADVIIASLPVTSSDAHRMGILQVNPHYEIVNFCEKPKVKRVLDELRTSDEILEKEGFNPQNGKNYLGSMGIYLFKRKALIDILQQDGREDFGKHLIPTLVAERKAKAYLYKGYWEDIGTIDTFYQANMGLLQPTPSFSFYNESRPVFSSRLDLPPATISQTWCKDVLLCEGGIIDGSEITHSIIGPRSVVRKGTVIRDSYIMGNDYYRSPIKDHFSMPEEPFIGENCEISQAIIDKNVIIGNGVKLINQQKLTNYDGQHIFIRNGIILVTRGANLPDGFIL